MEEVEQIVLVVDDVCIHFSGRLLGEPFLLLLIDCVVALQQLVAIEIDSPGDSETTGCCGA